MNKMTTKLLAMAAVSAGFILSADAAVLLYENDFSSDTMMTDSRLELDQQTPSWTKDTSSAWAISGGTLNNTSHEAGIISEGAVGTVYSVGSASELLNQVTVSFDYNVGLDSTLYFNLIGLFDDGATAPGNTDLHNTGTTNGAIQSQHEAEFTDVNMNNGLDASGSPGAAAASFAPGTSGSYTRTFNLYDYLQEGHSFVTLADYDYFTIVFSRNDNGAVGTGVSIDNFLFTASSAPEPSSLALIVMGGLMLLGRKKKLSNSSL